jgi:energy-coupling factor transporter ATP-binding protein EcfA2
MASAAVEVESLYKRYPGAVALDGIGFTIARGTTAALLGGNGAGKTTTLAIILGLLLPSSGRVRVLGENMLKHRYRVLPRINFSSPLHDGAAARRVFRRAAGDGLGHGTGDLRPHSAPRHGRREPRLARRLRAGAGQRGLLPGVGAAPWLPHVAWALPSTYVFEGMRAVLLTQHLRSDYLLRALALESSSPLPARSSSLLPFATSAAAAR